jgi:hypothetical protein
VCHTNSPATEKEQLSMSQLTKSLNQHEIKGKKNGNATADEGKFTV